MYDRASGKCAVPLQDDPGHHLNLELTNSAMEMEEPTYRERKKKAPKIQSVDGEDAKSIDSEERRLRRSVRKAKKIAKNLEALALAATSDELDDSLKYPVREWTFTIPGMRNEVVSLNPVVAMIAVLCLWGIVLWVSLDAANALATLDGWRVDISLTFTWLIHGTKVTILVFLLFLVVKYGRIRLGTNNDKPEFSNLSYFSMIFAAGATNSILSYAVKEPLWHQSGHFFAQAGYHSQDELDMFAINMTVTDWGFGCWAAYTVVAVAMSLAVYRFKLPMTFRSCFYPIFGQYTWGWIGDVIDGFIIVAIMANIVTSLGFAAQNVVAGLIHIKWIESDISAEQVTSIQNTIVWVLSIVSLVSVVSGLYGGIRLFCIAAMGLSSFLLFFAFTMEDTKYLLNLQVQEVGTYFQYSIFQLNFWTDAFGQLREGSGRAVDDKSAHYYTDWFNFAQLWWVVAGAANGQFISCISKGRLLGEVVLYSLVVPVVYCLVWFCVWGGIALRQSRQAAELEILGLTLFNNSAHFMTDGNEYCYDVPQDDILAGEETVFINYLHGVTPVCKFNGDNPDSAVFNVLNAFSFPRAFRRGGGFGKGLSLLFMLACCVFYMTAAGSASLIVDKMASSGRKNIHLARRMFWLVTVGALTTALLTKGGAAALAAIQAGIVICGVPCAILLCYMLQSITLMCHQTADNQVGDYEFPNQNEFSMPVYGGVFNILEYAASLGKVNEASRDRGKSTVTKAQAIEFLKGVLVPFVTMWQVLSVAYPQNPRTNVYLVVCQALSYLALLCFWLAPHWWQDLESLIWTPLAIHGGILVIVRSAFRARYQIRSNAIADVITSTFFWPQVLSQMVLYHREVPLVDALVATTTGAAAEDACALKQRRKRSVSSADEAVASLEPADMSPPLELVNVDVDNISKPKAGETTEI